jgi:hypothetical protein
MLLQMQRFRCADREEACSAQQALAVAGFPFCAAPTPPDSTQATRAAPK